MPLELSAITGALVKLGAEKAFTNLTRREAVIKARERIGLPAEPKPSDFEAIYRHALVEWGTFKPEPVLDFFRDQRIYDAFRRAWYQNDPRLLQAEAEEVVRWAEEFGAFRGLEYDPRRELAAFTAAFDLVVDYTRTAAEARGEARLAQMQRQMDEMLALIRALTPAQASQAVAGDVHFSGQFNNVIINLLSQLSHATQSVGATTGYSPPPLPPLDEHGRPPLPEAHRDLPPGSRSPYDPNPFFTGREDELRDLARELLYAPAGAPVVISTGIGGIGKTQLAVEFVHRYGRYFAGGAQWVSLADGDPAAVAREVAECGLRLGLWAEDDDARLSPEEKVRRTRRAWARPEPRLIVFDNCDGGAPGDDGRPARDARDLLDAWRPEPGGARLLVTSRSDDWPAGFAALAVPALPRPESIALLREYLARADPPRREGDAALDAVAAELGDLPLALTLAGSYLAEYPGAAVAAYLAELRAPNLLDHPSLRGQGRPQAWTKHDLDVARTFRVSLDRLRPDASAADAAARRLLAGAACLVPGEPFPRQLLLGMLDETDDPHLPDDALRRLLALGLLERAGEGRLRLHRLIARLVRESSRQGAREDEGAKDENEIAARAAVERAVERALYEANGQGDPRSLRGAEVHLRHVADRAAERDDEETSRLCGKLAYYLNMSGDSRGALPYSQRALAIRERVLGPEHPDTAQSLNNLGALLKAQGDLVGARPYDERALAIREHVLGPEHPDTAASLNNLGALLWAQGDLAGARPYFERTLAIWERVLGPEHPDTALSLNNLGVLLDSMGDRAGARPYYERALAIRERVLGPEHPDTATSLNNLGALLDSQGDLAGARPYYERALAINERVLGPEHPDTALSLNNLGYLLYAQGDLAGARPYYERALAIRERVLGPEHPDTAQSLNNLGALLQAQGDLAGARPYHERALAIRERVLGPEHPDTAASLTNLGGLLNDEGDNEEALTYYRRALDIQERVLGPDHPNTSLSLHNVGALLFELGRPEEARPLLERALAIRMAKLGPNHPDTGSTLDWLADLR